MFELNEKQLSVVEKYLRGEITFDTTNEQDQIIMVEVLDKAEKALQETDEIIEDDLIQWYYGKCKE